METKIVEQAAFTTVGIRVQAQPKSPELGQLWSEQGMRLGEVPNALPNGAFGVMDMVDMEQNILEYMAAVSVSEVGELPDGMSVWEVPEGTYAVFETTLPTIGEGFDAFYSKWLPESAYQRACGPEFEHYGPSFNPHEPDSVVSVYVPVKPK